ncbi:uncharacterized protein LACBIDRAFT_314667 [Laccaria bicolor S238N-H82]|uniref:Predicted protein n=1 Tax=Laccaria bicolor (strain S238N-H82 / ATCC MYA-4686) TaxID=486041 RepID=B0DYZ3_LACBS|nr:uncharacterized protein LACBIDRAFT_314667 [Laccaria bicolor S238N-H82]EDR00143.1 predicted protein [Laccaria bicolor S238N-H82]|eukprot:XP_001889200.1 predicted protein [Laccaria bicolor S238N-H82]
MAANEIQHWGATLFDFYYVRRMPDFGGLQTTSTGSKLATWMKANGEDYAKDELELAEEEEDPQEIFPCDIVKLVETTENRERTGISEMLRGSDRGGKGKEKEFFRHEPFDATFTSLPILQQRLPLHLLPTTLHVHDPFRLLQVQRGSNGEHSQAAQSWSSQPDIVHTYRHTVSSAGKENMEKEKKKLISDREFEEVLQKGAKPEGHSSKLPPYGFYIQGDADPTPGPTEPWVYVMHEPPPLLSTPAEAHLYFSPSHMAGKGNHSFAYHAEWDIPRDILVPDVLCEQCVIDEAQKIIAAEDAEGTDSKWTTKRGEVVLKEYVRPEFVTTMHEEPDIYVLRERIELNKLVYEGPVRIVRTTVGYQNPARGGYCVHLSEHARFKHPLRATVRVTAKLSMQGDAHLSREARNYQAFPDHFFQHWNGYNVVPPLHEPVPVGALVPQYYGHYVPVEDIPVRKEKRETGVDEVVQSDAGDVDDDASMESEPVTDESEGESEDEENSVYRSPIILMENCGSPININALNIDDKHECASLFYRFHHAGWVHNSVAPRNVLFQPGPLTEFPVFRTINQMASNPRGRVFSFRLIDFGRSELFKNPMVRASEEAIVGTTIGVLGLGGYYHP